MLKRILLAAAISLPTYAQTTTTTVTTDPPPPTEAAPPPPQNPQSPSTQVVVNPPPPNQAAPAPAPQPAAPPPQVVVAPVDSPPPTIVRDDSISVENRPAGRSAVAIVAIDGLYGGVAGAVVGGGVTLIDQGNNWARDIMVGAGIGVLVGASYGVFEAATQTRVPDRAIADRNPAASDIQGVAPAAYATRF